MPDHTDDTSLFAKSLQAQTAYGVLLLCEQFAPHPWHDPGMVGAPAGLETPRPNSISKLGKD